LEEAQRATTKPILQVTRLQASVSHPLSGFDLSYQNGPAPKENLTQVLTELTVKAFYTF